MIETAHYPKDKFPDSDELESAVAVVRAIRFFNNEPEMATKNQIERHEQKVKFFQNEISVFLLAGAAALFAYEVSRSLGWTLIAFIVFGIFFAAYTTKRSGKR